MLQSPVFNEMLCKIPRLFSCTPFVATFVLGNCDKVVSPVEYNANAYENRQYHHSEYGRNEHFHEENFACGVLWRRRAVGKCGEHHLPIA